MLVCGASGGLGRALCQRLRSAGATVSAIGRNADRLQQADASRSLSLDLRSPEACADAVAWASQDRPIDLVINAVGVVAFGPVTELSTDAMEELFLTNTFVPIMLSRAALPRMAEGGTIVQLSGTIAEQNLPGMAAYGASKAALRSFNEAFAREARRRKVLVLDARPPHTETGLADRPIEGSAPKMPTGLDPDAVADRILDAVSSGERDLPAASFT
ncbi:MAG: SDR family NAD(P)-dependent oxidoreductase [Acidimicrobiales bacterium]|nr:SDR family NAD(P)-dependent oxidoreductase [Acidimicrobiales bacterium]